VKGHISISRRTGGGVPESVHIEIEEDNSGIRFVDIELTLEGFARAITGHGNVPGKLTVRGLDRVGWNAENKTEEVPYDLYSDERNPKAALAPYEVNGWRARSGDLENGHCQVPGKKAQRVVFFRHVKPAPAPAEPKTDRVHDIAQDERATGATRGQASRARDLEEEGGTRRDL